MYSRMGTSIADCTNGMTKRVSYCWIYRWIYQRMSSLVRTMPLFHDRFASMGRSSYRFHQNSHSYYDWYRLPRNLYSASMVDDFCATIVAMGTQSLDYQTPMLYGIMNRNRYYSQLNVCRRSHPDSILEWSPNHNFLPSSKSIRFVRLATHSISMWQLPLKSIRVHERLTQ